MEAFKENLAYEFTIGILKVENKGQAFQWDKWYF